MKRPIIVVSICTVGLLIGLFGNGTVQQLRAAPPNQKDPAVSSAESWLALVDKADYTGSWKDAAPFFTNAVTEAAWESSMNAYRKPLGDLVSRNLKSAHHETQLPGAPDGQYVVMQFETSFANKKSAVETITVGPEQDDQWKVSGYYIK
jgi:hypothetical protein